MDTVVNSTTNQPEPEPKRNGLVVWVAAGALLGLTAANGFLFWRTSSMEAEIRQLKAGSQSEMVAMQDRTTAITDELRRTIDDLNVALEDSRTKAAFAATRAKATAEQHAEQMIKNLAAQHEKAQQTVVQQIGAVQEEAKLAAQQNLAKVTEVATEVGSVKQVVNDTRSELDKTVADLRTARGDMGVQSGLIATNSKELAALKELNDRNYYEFNITKANKSYKVGGVVLTLKKTDTKRNKFNLDLVADDKRVEKKDKTINEPVQWYMSGYRQPYELVVNEVQKDRIVGYLATPKVMRAQR